MDGMACAVGVDIGGSYTKIGVVDAGGAVIYQEVLQTAAHANVQPYLEAVSSVIRRLVKRCSPCGIGLSLPGFLSENRRVILYNPNTPALLGLDFAQELAREVDLDGLPTAFEADLNTPALAEYYFGERRGCRRLLTAVIGTGLGAAVALDGRLLRLVGSVAGDNGHIILQPGGPRCTAGCQGCAEALVSAPAIARLFQSASPTPERAAIQREIDLGASPTQAVIQQAACGNLLAQAILDELGAWLGQWLAGLAATFLPEVIILCGGVSEAGEPLRLAADRRLRELAGPEYTAHCEVVTGKFRGQAGLIGATAPLFFGAH